MSSRAQEAANAINSLIEARVGEEMEKLRQQLSKAGVKVTPSGGPRVGSVHTVADALDRLANRKA